MGLTLTWLSIIILIPLAGLFLRTFELSLDQFWGILVSRRTLNALRISFGLAFAAAAVNLLMGMVIVWALVRYSFPGRRGHMAGTTLDGTRHPTSATRRCELGKRVLERFDFLP